MVRECVAHTVIETRDLITSPRSPMRIPILTEICLYLSKDVVHHQTAYNGLHEQKATGPIRIQSNSHYATDLLLLGLFNQALYNITIPTKSSRQRSLMAVFSSNYVKLELLLPSGVC